MFEAIFLIQKEAQKLHQMVKTSDIFGQTADILNS